MTASSARRHASRSGTAPRALIIPGDADRRARPWLPMVARPRQIWIAPDGEPIRFGDTGTVDEVETIFPHLRCVASCPANRRIWGAA